MTLRVKLFAADAAGCGFYRMRSPGAAVAARTTDIEVTIVSTTEDPESLVIRTEGFIGNQYVTGVDDPECDVVVLQRPMNRYLIEAIPLIQQWGTAVVVECDDDFSRVHPKNPAWQGIQPHLSPDTNILWFNLAVQMADLVTVSTPSLVKRYGQHGRIRLLPNYIPESWLKIEHDVSITMLGWPGNAKVHPGDLIVVGNAVQNLERHSEIGFKAIGTRQTFIDLKIDPDDARNVLVDWVELERYPEEVAKIGVGLVPLALTPFNRAKSWLKGLEFAALGVPFVASPLPEYKKLSHLGAGETAESPDDWERRLDRLATNDNYREVRSGLGRSAATELTIEKHAEEWARAWADAAAYRQSA